MPNYRRAHVPGGTFFFTLVTEGRSPILCEPPAQAALRESIHDCGVARPFAQEAMVLLPDHLHFILALPPGDGDFATRLAAIKAGFTRRWLDAGGAEAARSASRLRRRSRGVWQPRF